MMIHNPIGVLSLSHREVYRFLSVATQTLFPPLVSSALFMYIFGVAVGSRIHFEDTGFSYLAFIVPGLMTLHTISSSYENTSASLFIARWHNHIQEILLAPLSYFEMVLGLLAGGVARGLLVGLGVWGMSLFFSPLPAASPLGLLFFLLMISVIFSCTGMLAALWAEDFNMLNLWNIYLIVPLVLLGGVFHPIELLPRPLQAATHLNPMFYLIQGVRGCMNGNPDVPLWICGIVAVGLAVSLFAVTVWLFKKGYKLRT